MKNKYSLVNRLFAAFLLLAFALLVSSTLEAAAGARGARGASNTPGVPGRPRLPHPRPQRPPRPHDRAAIPIGLSNHSQ